MCNPCTYCTLYCLCKIRWTQSGSSRWSGHNWEAATEVDTIGEWQLKQGVVAEWVKQVKTFVLYIVDAMSLLSGLAHLLTLRPSIINQQLNKKHTYIYYKRLISGFKSLSWICEYTWRKNLRAVWTQKQQTMNFLVSGLLQIGIDIVEIARIIVNGGWVVFTETCSLAMLPWWLPCWFLAKALVILHLIEM